MVLECYFTGIREPDETRGGMGAAPGLAFGDDKLGIIIKVHCLVFKKVSQGF